MNATNLQPNRLHRLGQEIHELRQEVEALYARRINHELTEEEAHEYQEKDALLDQLERVARSMAFTPGPHPIR